MNEHHIVGPPGTGKTWTLRHWVERAAEKFGHDGVLVSSFTKAAARELVRRGVPVIPQNVGTLHAICYRALGRPTIAESKIAEWNSDAKGDALGGERPSIDDPYAHRPQGRTSSGDRSMQQAQRLRQLRIPIERWPDHVRGFQRRWDAWKDANGYVDFTELLELALERIPIAPGAPPVGFFDEAQDFSRLELAVVRSWMTQMEYGVLVFDADQTLYDFKGADPKALLSADLPPENTKVLKQSYRVPRAVHALAKTWIERSSFRYPAEYLPRDADGELAHVGSTYNNPQAIVADIEKSEGDGMVLASCSYMLQPLLKHLRRMGIPFHNPYRVANGAWNPMRGAQRLVDFLVPDPRLSKPDRPNRLWTFDEMRMWAGAVKAAGTFQRGAKKEIDRIAKERTSDEAKAKPMTGHEVSCLLEPEAERTLVAALESGKGSAWLRERLLPLPRKKMEYAFEIEHRHGIDALLKEPKLVVGTVHSVKGGEADNVWLFPDLSPAAYQEWLGTPDQRDSIRRTFYVGATRARHRLALANPAGPQTIRWTQ